MICTLLSRVGVQNFDVVLDARRDSLGPLVLSIDGGAGWGATAEKIAERTANDGLVYAFEPFPGNHRFFKNQDSRIKLVKAAISDHAGHSRFCIPKVVTEGDDWGARGFVGYSSLGHIESFGESVRRRLKSLYRTRRPNQSRAEYISVETVRIDGILQPENINFVKLDLQGGEFLALQGMGDLLNRTEMLWIEFSDQKSVTKKLLQTGFILFDTNYLCINTSRQQLKELGLEPVRETVLSTSTPALFAKRVIDVDDYSRWFRNARKSGVVQTDLLAVNQKFLEQFLSILCRLQTML